MGVAGAGALGARLHAEGEHEAVTGLRIGGHGERGVRRAFLPQRQVLGTCIARWSHGDIPMRIEAPTIGVDDGRCKSNALTGCGAAVVHDLGNIRRMRTGRGLVGTPLRAGGEVLLVGAQIGIRIAIDGRTYGSKTGRRI